MATQAEVVRSSLALAKFDPDPLERIAREHDGSGLKEETRHALLRRADAFLASRLGQPFNLGLLAGATGATKRTLQREFARAYGMSPFKWARCLALHHVHRRLLEGDAKKMTVEGLAREAGFRHMGRFPGLYLQVFGEYPSITLGRRI